MVVRSIRCKWVAWQIGGARILRILNPAGPASGPTQAGTDTAPRPCWLS